MTFFPPEMAILVTIGGFQSHDTTAMLVHKTMAKYGSCFA